MDMLHNTTNGRAVELLWVRPLVVLYNMSVAGVCVVEFGTNMVETN